MSCTLRTVNPRKATQSNGVTGRVLRECADQLPLVFTKIFITIITVSGTMPLWLKPATIVPLPTKTNNREPQHLLTLCSDPYYNECFGMFWLYATLYSASHPSLTHFSLHIELTERQHTSLLQCSTLTSPALNNTIQ